MVYSDYINLSGGRGVNTIKKNREKYRKISLLEQQYVIILTIRQTEIPALLDVWVKTHRLSEYCVHKKLLLLILS
jgi:hypothetical protein